MNREPAINNSPDPIAAQPPKVESDSPESIESLGAKLSETLGGTALNMGKTAVETVAGVSAALTTTAQQTGKTVVDTAASLGEVLGHTNAQTSRSAIETATALSSIVGKTSARVGQTAIDFATWASDVALWVGEATAKQSYQWVEQATKGTGQAVTAIGNNGLVRRLSGVLRIDWLVGISDRVDLEKAQDAVRQLQAKHPDESPREIAHRIMVEKAMYAAGTGVVSSLVPGAALALLAIDLAATTALQTEMLYQIAGAYGLELQDPARKGEVLAIFGLALGGSKALQAGLGFLRNVPLAGAMIGAGTNATMMYTLGYAACQFYEAKQKGELVEANLDSLQQASDRYLQKAIEQQKITDQVLARMLLASYPNKTWKEIQPELERLQLSDRSIEQISDSLRSVSAPGTSSPRSLDHLLEQLDSEFAAPLYVQCQRIQRMDRAVNSAEAEILAAIEQRFDLPQSG